MNFPYNIKIVTLNLKNTSGKFQVIDLFKDKQLFSENKSIETGTSELFPDEIMMLVDKKCTGFKAVRVSADTDIASSKSYFKRTLRGKSKKLSFKQLHKGGHTKKIITWNQLNVPLIGVDFLTLGLDAKSELILEFLWIPEYQFQLLNDKDSSIAFQEGQPITAVEGDSKKSEEQLGVDEIIRLAQESVGMKPEEIHKPTPKETKSKETKSKEAPATAFDKIYALMDDAPKDEDMELDYGIDEDMYEGFGENEEPVELNPTVTVENTPPVPEQPKNNNRDFVLDPKKYKQYE